MDFASFAPAIARVKCPVNSQGQIKQKLFLYDFSMSLQQQYIERKKMAAVHFTTIPCEPNIATRYIESLFLLIREICPCTNNIVYARFEDLITFLCDFMSVFRVFVRLELWVNVPVVVFFGKVWWIEIIDPSLFKSVQFIS